ncbi:stage II sporulation protein M [Paenibacillus sp. D51F]
MSNRMKAYFVSIKQVRRQFWLGCLLFAAGAWIGAVNESFHAMLDGQMNQIRELAKTLQESGNPTVSFFLFIFFNNAVKALIVMAAGILFGALPVFFLVMNGMVLGYLWTIESAEAGTRETLLHFAKGILPHGIIEIPVIILAAAYGMKLGGYVWRWLALALSGRETGSIRAEWKAFRRSLVPAATVVVLLLLAAAIVESTLTRWILQL